MTNKYFNHTDRLIPFSSARAEDMNDLLDAVASGFDQADVDVTAAEAAADADRIAAEAARVAAQAAQAAAETAQTGAQTARTGAETAQSGAETARDSVLNDLGFQAVSADLAGPDTIGTVATNIANVNTTATNVANINVTGGAIANVNTVATSIANVDTAATNVANINTAAANIANITAAPGAASAALASELKAADWAEKPTEVEAGQFSAKYWADQAALNVADGVIDDAVTSTLRTWSSQKISDDLATKGDVTLTGTQTLTNKTLSGVVLNDGYTEEVFVLVGTTPALSAANGSIQTWDLTANSTPTDGLATGQSIILGIDDGTAYTVTWPSVTWSKIGSVGAAPALATTGRTWAVLWKVGATLYGSHLGDA